MENTKILLIFVAALTLWANTLFGQLAVACQDMLFATVNATSMTFSEALLTPKKMQPVLTIGA